VKASETGAAIRNRTAADRVYERFYDDLRSQALGPGSLLLEEELARRYEVSRTPVREALRRLAQDGLVERSGGSLRVSQLTRAGVDQIYPIVAVLEGLAARLAAQQMSTAQLAQLDELHQRMKLSADGEDHVAYLKANQRFHALLLEAADNPPLAREIERFRLITLQLRQVMLRLPGRHEESVAEHEQLLDALRERDGARSETLMRHHVERAHEVLAVALMATELVSATHPTSGARRQTHAPKDN
jgi:DNA-binding GntR family transcriptional regulator